ncbi:hypothetical protein ACHAXS_007909 [Conticribra weissflogii]
MTTAQPPSHPRNTTHNTSITPTSRTPTPTPIIRKTHRILQRQSRRIRSIPRSRTKRRNNRLLLLRRPRRQRRHQRRGWHGRRHGRNGRRQRNAGRRRWHERRRRSRGSSRCRGAHRLRVIRATLLLIRRKENATIVIPADDDSSPTPQKPFLPPQKQDVIVPGRNERPLLDRILRPDRHLVLFQDPVRTRHHRRGVAVGLVSDSQLPGSVVSHRVDGTEEGVVGQGSGEDSGDVDERLARIVVVVGGVGEVGGSGRIVDVIIILFEEDGSGHVDAVEVECPDPQLAMGIGSTGIHRSIFHSNVEGRSSRRDGSNGRTVRGMDRGRVGDGVDEGGQGPIVAMSEAQLAFVIGSGGEDVSGPGEEVG